MLPPKKKRGRPVTGRARKLKIMVVVHPHEGESLASALKTQQSREVAAGVEPRRATSRSRYVAAAIEVIAADPALQARVGQVLDAARSVSSAATPQAVATG